MKIVAVNKVQQLDEDRRKMRGEKKEEMERNGISIIVNKNCVLLS